MSKEDAPLPLQPPFSAEYRPPASRRGRRANSSASLFGRLGGFGGGGGGSGVAGGGSGSGGGFGAGNGRPVDIATSSSGGGSSDGSSAGGVRTTLGSLFRSSKRSTTRLSGGGGDVEQHFDLARRASQNTLKSDRESDADSVASSTRRRASGSRSSIRSFVGGIARKFRSRDSLFAPEDLPPPVVPMPPLLDAVGSGGGGGSRGSSAFSAMTDPAQAQAQAQSQAPGVPVEPPNPWTRSWNAHPQPPTAHAALSSPPLVEAVSTKVTAESTASDSSGLRAEEPLSTGLPPLPPSHSPRFPPRITPQLADPIEAISPTTIFSVLYGSHPASAVADSTLIVGTSTATSSSTPFSSAPYPPSSFSSSSSSSFHSPPQLSPSRQSSAMEPPPALLLSHSLGETNPEPTSSDMSDACASSITPATHMDAHFTKRSESPGASAYPESSTINETALTLPRTASKRISTDAETDRSRPLSPSPTKLAISRRSFQSQTQPRPFSPSLRQSLIIGHGPVSVSHPHFATAPRRPTTTSPISTLNRSSSVRSAKSAAVIQHVVHANVASSAAKAGGKLSSAGRLFWVPDHVQASDEGIVGEDFRAWLDAARARRMAAGTSLKDFSSPPGADAPSVKTDSAAPPAAFFGNNASTASIADRPLLDHEADFPIDDPIRLARAALTRKMSFKERHVVITPDNIDEMPDAGETASAAREEDKNITDTRRGPPDPLSRNTTFRRATPSPPPASPTLRSAPPNGAALRQDAVGVGRRFSFESQSSTPSPPSSPLFSPVGHSSLHSTASPIVTIASPGRTQLNHATIPSQSVDRVISRLQEADGVDGIMEHVDHSEVRAVAFAAMEALEAAKWVDAVMSNGAAPDDLESHSVPTLAQRMEDAPLSPISPPRPQILSTTHRLHENLSDRWGGDVDDSKGEASELVGLNDITAAEGHGRLDGSGDIASDSALGSKAESIQSETESELSDSDWSNSSSPVDPESPFDPFTSLEQLVDPQMLPLSSPGRDEYLKDTSTGGTFAETEVEPSEAVPPLEKSTSTNAPSSHSEKTAISPRRVATLSINTKDLGNLDTQLKAGYPAAAVPVDVVGETPPTPESDESQNSVAPFALPAESGDLDHEQALRERQQQQHQKTPVAALEKPSTWSWFSGLMHSGSGSNAKHRKAAAIGSERAGKAVDLPTSLNNSSLSGKPGAAKIGITQRLFGGGGGGNSGSGGSGAGVGDVLQKSPILELEHDLRASGNTAATNQDWSRFPLEVEKSIYRSSHVKLAQDRRPLLQQVVISNLMLFILSVHADVTLNRQGPKRRKKGKKGKKKKNADATSGDKDSDRTTAADEVSVEPVDSGRIAPGRLSKKQLIPEAPLVDLSQPSTFVAQAPAAPNPPLQGAFPFRQTAPFLPNPPLLINAAAAAASGAFETPPSVPQFRPVQAQHPPPHIGQPQRPSMPLASSLPAPPVPHHLYDGGPASAAQSWVALASAPPAPVPAFAGDPVAVGGATPPPPPLPASSSPSSTTTGVRSATRGSVVRSGRNLDHFAAVMGSDSESDRDERPQSQPQQQQQQRGGSAPGSASTSGSAGKVTAAGGSTAWLSPPQGSARSSNSSNKNWTNSVGGAASSLALPPGSISPTRGKRRSVGPGTLLEAELRWRSDAELTAGGAGGLIGSSATAPTAAGKVRTVSGGAAPRRTSTVTGVSAGAGRGGRRSGAAVVAAAAAPTTTAAMDHTVSTENAAGRNRSFSAGSLSAGGRPGAGGGGATGGIPTAGSARSSHGGTAVNLATATAPAKSSARGRSWSMGPGAAVAVAGASPSAAAAAAAATSAEEDDLPLGMLQTRLHGGA